MARLHSIVSRNRRQTSFLNLPVSHSHVYLHTFYDKQIIFLELIVIRHFLHSFFLGFNDKLHDMI